MIQGKSTPLLSSFRLSYYTLLNLLRRIEGSGKLQLNSVPVPTGGGYVHFCSFGSVCYTLLNLLRRIEGSGESLRLLLGLDMIVAALCGVPMPAHGSAL